MDKVCVLPWWEAEWCLLLQPGKHYQPSLWHVKITSTWVLHKMFKSDKSPRIGVCESWIIRSRKRMTFWKAFSGVCFMSVRHGCDCRTLDRLRGWATRESPAVLLVGFQRNVPLWVLFCWDHSDGQLSCWMAHFAWNARSRDKVRLLHDNVVPRSRSWAGGLPNLGILPCAASSPTYLLSPTYFASRIISATKIQWLERITEWWSQGNGRLELETEVVLIFDSQATQFWVRRIKELPDRCILVFVNDGDGGVHSVSIFLELWFFFN